MPISKDINLLQSFMRMNGCVILNENEYDNCL